MFDLSASESSEGRSVAVWVEAPGLKCMVGSLGARDTLIPLVSFLERYCKSYLGSMPRLHEVLGLILKTLERKFDFPIKLCISV